MAHMVKDGWPDDPADLPIELHDRYFRQKIAEAIVESHPLVVERGGITFVTPPRLDQAEYDLVDPEPWPRFDIGLADLRSAARWLFNKARRFVP